MASVPKKVVGALVVMVAVVVLTATPALALWGIGDTGDGVLAAILANAVKALKTANETYAETKDVRELGAKAYKTGKDVYALASHTAQAAEQAVLLGSSMRDFSASRFGEKFTQDLEVAFPEVAYWRQEAANPLGLGRYSDATMSNALKYCLADAITYKDACQRLKGKTEEERTRAMMELTFGMTRSSASGEVPKTAAERARQSCEDLFQEVMVQVAAEEKTAAETAAKLTDLRRKCETIVVKKTTYGAFQTIADDAKRVSEDLDGLAGKTSEKAGESPEAAKARAEACTALREQQAMIADETAKYSRITELKKQKLELCQMGQKFAEEREQKAAAVAEAAAGYRSQVQQKLKANSRTGAVVGTDPSVGAGYDIIADPAGGRAK